MLKSIHRADGRSVDEGALAPGENMLEAAAAAVVRGLFLTGRNAVIYNDYIHDGGRASIGDLNGLGVDIFKLATIIRRIS